jgi:hypothetical protein
MKIDTMSMFFSTIPMICFAADDETGSGGDAGDGGEGGDAGTDEGQTAKPVLGSDETPDEGAKLGDDAADEKDGDEGDDGQTDEEKEAAAKAAEIPEDGSYEFKLPDGVELSEEDQTAWSEQFKEAGLTRGQADALIKAQSERALAEAKAHTDAVEALQKEHLEKAKTDPDIGGEKWDASVKKANAALRVLRGGPKGDPDAKNADGTSKGFKPEGALEKLILQSGNGNNPDVIKELNRIGQKLVDDNFDRGDTTETVEKSTEQHWYGNTTPDKKKG